MRTRCGSRWRARRSCSASSTSARPTCARRKAAGQRLQIRVLGLASIADDVTPELALAAIESIAVLGALHASPAVKAALAGRIR